jgi:hypothetical protein
MSAGERDRLRKDQAISARGARWAADVLLAVPFANIASGVFFLVCEGQEAKTHVFSTFEIC